MPNDIAQRHVGDATITAIYDATDGWNPRWQVREADWRPWMPEADAAGEMSWDTTLFHVRLGDTSLLVDVGHGEVPERYLGDAPDRRGRPLVDALAEIGVRPGDVTHVVFTHAHGDHFFGATVGSKGEQAVFPRARHLIGKADWVGNPARERPGSAAAVELAALDRLGLLETVDGDQTIAPGIDVLHAPGESPGHQVLRVRSGGQLFYSLGDLFHHPVEVAHVDWIPEGRDLEATIASRSRIVEAAIAEDALCSFTHAAFPSFGRIVRAGAGQRWEPA